MTPLRRAPLGALLLLVAVPASALAADPFAGEWLLEGTQDGRPVDVRLNVREDANQPLSVRRVANFEDNDARSFFSVGGDGTALAQNCPAGSAAIRWADDIDVIIAQGSTGSWVVIVVHGQHSMSEVHPGKVPFAVINPIYLTR